MRISALLLPAAALGAALTAAAAQDAAPPADPPAKAEQPAPGLSDLDETVEELQDEAAPADAPPVEPPATPPAETPAPAPVAPPPTSAPPRVAGPIEPLTRAQRAELEAAAARGRLLGVIARAGIVATQDMLSRVSDPDGAGIAGWIAEPEGNGVAVTFYADSDAGPVMVYRVNILGGRIQGRQVHLTGARPPLNPIQARMAAARAATAGLDHQVCGGADFNALVVPPTAPDGPIDVYQISPQSARGRFPVGGHYRTSVAADGSVIASRGFTNACLEVAAAPPAAGAQPAPVAVTHLLDPLPTEIHVFLAIWTGHPLVVVAGDPQRLFAVTPDRIAEIPR
ncbi:MAG TPA: hypothetical protein VEW71_07080 [Allosphingosinicella sp.]|nr:hypothetical protein [Allosphingosinicella sp.]